MRKWWAVSGATLLALAAAGGIWYTRSRPVHEPPAPDLAGIDPEVVAFVKKERQQVVEHPGRAHGWGRLAMVYMANGFAPEADICLREAERLDPHDPRWPYLRATTLLRTQPDEGIELLKRAVERSGVKPLTPRLVLAEALLARGRLDEAETQLHRALQIEPKNHRALVGLARLALLREQWQTVLDQTAPCLDDPSARKEVRAMRARAWRELGQAKRASEERDQAAALPQDAAWPDPSTDDVLRLQRGLLARLGSADLLASAGYRERAIQNLEELARDYPHEVEVWIRLGKLQHELGANERAVKALKQAVQADPKAAEAWFRLGEAQAGDQPRQAAESFDRAINLKPDHTEAHYERGLCLQKLDDRAGAATEFRAALRCNPAFKAAQDALAHLSR